MASFKKCVFFFFFFFNFKMINLPLLNIKLAAFCMGAFRKTIFSFLLFILFTGAVRTETQWASELLGFSSELDTLRYAAREILGKPSVMPDFGMSACAWASKEIASPSGEWIKVGFSKPMKIRQIAVNQNYCPGAVAKIFTYDESGNEYSVYEDKNPIVTGLKGKMLNVFLDDLTSYKVKAIKIVLKTNVFLDWNQIDAAAVSDDIQPVEVKVNSLPLARKRHQPENLGWSVNSPVDDLVPVISPDGKTLYFSRNQHPENTGPLKLLDVWFSEINDEGTFSPAQNMGGPINNEGPNFLFSVSPDNKTIYLGNTYHPAGHMAPGISKSTLQNGKWSKPVNLEIKDLNIMSGFATYFMSPGGKELYLSIQGPESYGGLDLYVSFLQKDGTWSIPENLGSDVNTASNEFSPFIAPDGKTLYFSTDGFPGFGQNDIFFSYRLDSTWKNWTEPVNMGRPVNSESGEAYWTLPASGETAYFVTNKNQGGKDDIFRIKLEPEQKPGSVKLIYGQVIDSKTGKPLAAEIVYEILPDGTEAGKSASDNITGEYKIILPAGNKYGFLAKTNGYLSINEHIDLRNAGNYEEIKRDLYLVPIEKGQIVRMNNIFFEFGEYEILEDSYSELNRIAEFLRKNMNIAIRIDGHTDNIGSNEDNLSLSRNRARAVAEYLYEKGIAENRIKIKGFGESMPVASNDTEQGRAKNRRVEFLILED